MKAFFGMGRELDVVGEALEGEEVGQEGEEERRGSHGVGGVTKEVQDGVLTSWDLAVVVVSRYSLQMQSREIIFAGQLSIKRYLTKVGLDSFKVVVEATSPSV